MKRLNVFAKVLASALCVLIFFSFVSCESSDNKGLQESPPADSSVDFELPESSGSHITDRKIIYKATMDVRTEKYDDYIKNLKTKLNEYGGYFAYFKEYSSSERSLSAEIRIPADKYESMREVTGSLCTVTRSEQTANDVTANYMDIESRIASLKAQKESLDNMAKAATSTSELIEIQKAVSDVVYQLESYEKQLLAYDDLISYSTITLTVEEVNDEQPVKEGPFKRIGNNFMSSLKFIGSAVVEVFVFFIGYLPIFVVIGAIVAVIVIAVTRRKKK
ncbi:MAG: DUF4349 domain-containing protein [Eubacteriales bacterium]